MHHNYLYLLMALTILSMCKCANILMITMGGTKSHKIPFWEMARGLIPRGHNLTFINAFPPDFYLDGLEEITPSSLVFYVRNYTNWDLLGARMRGEEPVHPLDIIRYGYEACDQLLSDHEMTEFLYLRRKFDLIIMDGAYPECSVGLAYYFKIPFMYMNTVAFYTGSITLSGSPAPYSVTPFVAKPYTDSMNLYERTLNTIWYMIAYTAHSIMVRFMLQDVLRKHFGDDIPNVYDISKNVSFILQNGHYTVTYPRPYLPNVAEIACIHCKPSKPLPNELEKFIDGSGDAGFIYVSMGSSVKAANMPEYLRRMFMLVFKQLPQRVLWKWEGENMIDLPNNVMLSKWLPQQDLLGHPKIRAFVTHGGLLSMFETVYHGCPIVSLPVFCDHDSNAAKAELDGYALKLELSTLTAENLLWSIKKVIHDPRYKREVKRRQYLLKDQNETPLERAVYWVEYILRHNGAYHLHSPAKDMNVLQYYLIDVISIIIICLMLFYYLVRYTLKLLHNMFSTNLNLRKTIKLD